MALYHDFGDDGDLTVAEYESMGGMAQVVQNEVDKLLPADPEQRQAQLDTLHDAFIPWLATINPDNDQPMRRLARWDGLPTGSRPLIQAMVEKRLLVKDTRDGQTLIEAQLWGGTAGQPFDPNYHQKTDTLDHIDQTALDINGKAVAYAVGLYAQDLSGRNGVPVRDDRTRHVVAKP